MNKKIKEELTRTFKGEITDAQEDIKKASRDTSLFTLTPSLITYPTDTSDVSTLVKAIRHAKKDDKSVSVTARAGGTDMSGGPLTTSVVASFTKHMNKILEVGDTYAITQPGVYYRDFEKETLKKNLLLPSYPASREICAMGGIVANNSGGERTLRYGKTEKYVEELEVVLSDGTVTTFKALTDNELEEKKKLNTFEGEIYRKMDILLSENENLIEEHKPKVSKNSAGYALWSVRDKKAHTFNLAKLICGSQGTLALWTKAKLELVVPKQHRAMLVVFLKDMNMLPEVVYRVLAEKPESFESYDDKTFTLAIKLLPEMLKQMGFAKAVRLGIDFVPEMEMVAVGGVPKMILMAEFAEDTIEMADEKAIAAREALSDLSLRTEIEKNERGAEKYWIVRRESFSLLRKNLHGLYASPFIDDFVIPPETYPKFFLELNALLDIYKDHFIYTIAGHAGSGNFHIIPLMNIANPENRKVVLELAPKVYDLVIRYGGTTTGEHNDGIIRTPYLTLLFGKEVEKLFEQTKQIFDPENIFNPGKKVGGTFDDIERDMLRSNT